MRFLKSFFLTASGLLLLCQTSTGASASADEKGKCWLLEQTNVNLPSGRQSITLSANGIKIDSRAGLQMYILAPRYKVSLANEQAKTFFDMGLDDAVSRFMRDKGKTPQQQLSALIVRDAHKTAKIAGLKAQKFGLYSKKEGESEQLLKEFWRTGEIQATKKEMEIANALCQLPPGDGIPLRVIKFFPDGTKKVMTDTLAAKQRVLANKDTMLPSSYKRVTSYMQVMLAGDKEDSLKEMLQDGPGVR